jgi:signal transduction histidine kinase
MEPAWTFGTFSTVLVLLLMSVAVVTYTPAWLSATLYLLSMWIPVATVLWPATLHGMGPFGVTFVGVLALLCLGVYTTQRQLRRYLHKVAEVRQLAEQLAASNRELKQLRGEAHAQLHVRSQFFAGASHDFAQRLHALKLLAHVARGSAEQGADPALVMLKVAVADLEGYVREVLDFARFENAEISVQPASVHLQDVFQRLALNFDVVAESRGVGLRVRSTRAVVHTDPRLLQRLLENIVGNAIKFTRGDVLVAARRTGTRWRIEVWDQGQGIDPDALQQIFVAFYQGPHARGEAGAGLGLGLAIARRLAVGLNCEIAVRSRVGRGSVFTIRMA